MKLSVTGQGLLDPRKLKAWAPGQHARIRQATARAMRPWGQDVVKQVRAAMAQVFRLRGKKLPGSVRSKVFDQKLDELPAVYIGSKVPWLGAHERGASIAGPLLVPMPNIVGDRRIGEKAFRRVLDTIERTGAGFFKEVNGQVYLFAEYQAEYGAGFARFRRIERARRGASAPRRWAGQDIPIALVLRGGTKLRARLNLANISKRNLPALAARIEKELAATEGGLFNRRIYGHA